MSVVFANVEPRGFGQIYRLNDFRFEVGVGVRVLIACERTQVVCEAFRSLGIEAYSNDIEPCLGSHPEWHIIGDAAQVCRGHSVFRLQNGTQLDCIGFWDMMIAHPPCTMLSHSSAVALAQGKHTMDDVEEGALLFWQLWTAPITMVAIENPAPMRCAALPDYSQIIQPYQFGEPYSKRVCLWLRELPPLLRTTADIPHRQWLKHCSGRSIRRATTFKGIADAMSTQWGGLLL